MATSRSTPTLSLRADRPTGRYYVEVDGLKVGWVMRVPDGTWSFYASVKEAMRAETVASGEKTRRDALMEGFSTLGIYHLGRIVVLNRETWTDEAVWIGEGRATCDALYTRLLDEKYPHVAEALGRA